VLLSLVAEAVVDQLHVLDAQSMDAVAAEARQRRERWRATVRRAATGEQGHNRLRAARILDEIGVVADVSLLRSIARSMKSTKSGTSLGKGLARRLAARVMVEDLGRIEIQVGGDNMPGSDLRRKVLAMLVLLLTKPKFAATRDEVVDALWPDLAPEVALNSLNQTVYFLRRVFEPGYKEDLSAGYVNHDSDVLWLDQSLIGSRSKLCRDLLDTLGADPAPADVDRLSDLYRGRFALEFSYEEWAGPHREALHVGYLQVIEAAVNRDMDTGKYDRAIRLARRALDIDPEQESLELSLLHLYRITGAHAAAAEQYAHYSAFVRDELGVEPPPLSSL
jgi:DNA-binding SARP family transcriptional activator